jgi:transposase
MLQLDPHDPQELAFALHKAVRLSGLTLGEICERLKNDFGVELTPSGLSHVIHRGTIRLQRALQILAICGVSEIEIKGANQG